MNLHFPRLLFLFYVDIRLDDSDSQPCGCNLCFYFLFSLRYGCSLEEAHSIVNHNSSVFYFLMQKLGVICLWVHSMLLHLYFFFSFLPFSARFGCNLGHFGCDLGAPWCVWVRFRCFLFFLNQVGSMIHQSGKVH